MTNPNECLDCSDMDNEIEDKSLEERLSKNFKRKEFACYCGCGLANISMSLVNDVLQPLRDHFGPIRITKGGGCRCESAARRLYRKQGKKFNHKSQHLIGLAADIVVKRKANNAVQWWYERYHNGGIVMEIVPPQEVARFAAGLMVKFSQAGPNPYVINKAIKYGGIIVYETFTHLDVRDRSYRWGLKWKGK